MTRPNSRTTRLRTWLARKIEPWPPAHEAWCQDCILNGGRTLVIGPGGFEAHSLRHQSAGRQHVMRMKTRAGKETT